MLTETFGAVTQAEMRHYYNAKDELDLWLRGASKFVRMIRRRQQS